MARAAQKKNPAELVVFGNPRRRRGKKRAGKKPLLVTRAGRAKKKNPHRAGCGCAICKNARGEKHSAGCKCAVCRRGRYVNRGGKNPSVIINRNGRKGRNPQCNPRKRSRRRNAGETQQAVELYQAFHGKDPKGVIEKHVSAAMRLEYTALGDLEYLVIKPEDGRAVKTDFEGDGVKLASSPKGTQLYAVGGNQNMGNCLEKFGADATKDFIELGRAVEVQYFAHKAQANFQPVSYYHKFGEENGAQPMVIYDQLRKGIFFVGGEYRIEAPGIIN